MNDDVKLLNFIYQNSQMGVETIDQLEKIVEDKNFRSEEHTSELQSPWN